MKYLNIVIIFMLVYCCKPTINNNHLYPIKFKGKWGAINNYGRLIINPEYDMISDFVGGVALAKKRGKLGYIRSNGTILIPFIYDFAEPFSDGIAKIYDKNGDCIFIDTIGNVVFKPKVNETGSIGSYISGLAPAGIYGKEIFFVNKKGLIQLKTGYPFGGLIRENVIRLYNDTVNTYIDINGKVLFQILGRRTYCGEFSDGLALVVKGDSTRYYNRFGEVVIALKDEFYHGNFSEELAIIGNTITKQSLGYINKKGEIVIQMQFTTAYDFKEGLAAVRDSSTKKIGFIDKQGNWVILPQFDHVPDDGFNNGLALFIKNNKMGYVNKLGKIVWIEK